MKVRAVDVVTLCALWAPSIGARPAPRLHAKAIKGAVGIGVRPSPVHASPVGERRVAAAFIRITLQVGFTGTVADPQLPTDRRLAPAEPSGHEGNEDEKEAVSPCEIPNHRRTPESAIRSVECLYGDPPVDPYGGFGGTLTQASGQV